MNWRVLKLILSAVGLLPVVLWAESAEQIIAKARAYLGSESALQAIHTIHFTGTLEVDAHTRWPADIIFRKDYQQRITVNFEKYIETTALDHYDAWQMRVNPTGLTGWDASKAFAREYARKPELFFRPGAAGCPDSSERRGGRRWASLRQVIVYSLE